MTREELIEFDHRSIHRTRSALLLSAGLRRGLVELVLASTR
jgi:hypothetical protein